MFTRYELALWANWWSVKNVFVVSQYAITIGLIFGTLTVIQQIRHLKSVDTQLDMEEVLILNGPGVRVAQGFREAISIFSTELKSIPGIESVTTSNFVPGLKMDFAASLTNPVVHGDNNNLVKRIFADESFAEVYDIQVVAGRFFENEQSLLPEHRPIVVNESAALNLGFNPPSDIVGKEIRYWDNPIKVIGVVEDFRMESPDMPIEPMFFFPTYDTKYFSIKLSGSQPTNLISIIEEKWTKVYPGSPFDFFYSQAHFNRQYQTFEQLESQLFMLAVHRVISSSRA